MKNYPSKGIIHLETWRIGGLCPVPLENLETELMQNPGFARAGPQLPGIGMKLFNG